MRALSGLLGVIYLVALVFFTFLPLRLGSDPYENPWWIWVQLVPFQDILEDPAGLILNVALFVPLGVLAPLLLRTWRWWQTALVGLAVSAAVEILQFVGDITINPGRVADTDDLIANLAGAVLGFLLLRLGLAVPAFRRIAEKGTWPRSTDGHDPSPFRVKSTASSDA
jgi:glycopeptide antibiotics resistance protein